MLLLIHEFFNLEIVDYQRGGGVLVGRRGDKDGGFAVELFRFLSTERGSWVSADQRADHACDWPRGMDGFLALEQFFLTIAGFVGFALEWWPVVVLKFPKKTRLFMLFQYIEILLELSGIVIIFLGSLLSLIVYSSQLSSEDLSAKTLDK